MKTKLLSILIVVSVLLNLKIEAGTKDRCGTTSGSYGPCIPTSGTLKVLVIFAQFKDDDTVSTGWTKDEFPSWGSTFVNSTTGSTFPWNNLSQYFYDMSNGTFQVIGDVYGTLVKTYNNESDYSSIGAANYEILTRVVADPNVDLSQYDNLNGSITGSDGIVDFVYIIYRNATSSLWEYTAIAHLETSQTITADGKQIVTNSGIGGGVQQRGGFNGRDYTMYVAAHELGHYLFGSNHLTGTANLSLMVGVPDPSWNAQRGMCAWERHRLGWLNYSDISSDATAALTDYLSTDCAKRIVLPGTTSEYFLVESRQHVDDHDFAGDNGIYIYHVTGANSYPPTMKVECADGDWNFSFNTGTQTITRTTTNPTGGYNEMNYSHYYDDTNYGCYKPVYPTDAIWGDECDAFDPTYNNVFSPVSNPRSTNSASINFAIETTGTNSIAVYFTSPYAGSPSKPQNLAVSANTGNLHVRLDWAANAESDISLYEVQRKMYTGSWVTLGTTTNNYYVDDSWYLQGWSTIHMYYRVRAKDNTNKYSCYSNSVDCWPYPVNKENYTYSNSTIPAKYDITNYPNPFNPTTKINFQLPTDGFVTLKVYDILGKEVSTVVNGDKKAGYYSYDFDASKLAAGVYIYRITANDFVHSKKMLLVK